MHHTEPKFRVNQKVNCVRAVVREIEGLRREVRVGAIKGLRREARIYFDLDTSKERFNNPEWEYLIFGFNKNGNLDLRSCWGWVKESKLIELNSERD
ncbi:hypothetical protein IQ272_20940 [Chroococcidiopsidales cyanobacterium LEGE 13417]|nr:hypothetical protein [Chroococcidiopsidales cyanobacterium LEGE 13417]